DGMPFGRGLRQTDRGHPRADRAKLHTAFRRETSSPFPVRDVYPAGSPRSLARAAPRLSKIRPASSGSRTRSRQAAPEEMADDGGAEIGRASCRERGWSSRGGG